VYIFTKINNNNAFSGLAGGAAVEAPRVAENGTVVGWDVKYAPEREFGVDMAGFGIKFVYPSIKKKNCNF
jgi:hypothetical protein